MLCVCVFNEYGRREGERHSLEQVRTNAARAVVTRNSFMLRRFYKLTQNFFVMLIQHLIKPGIHTVHLLPKRRTQSTG